MYHIAVTNKMIFDFKSNITILFRITLRSGYCVFNIKIHLRNKLIQIVK